MLIALKAGCEPFTFSECGTWVLKIPPVFPSREYLTSAGVVCHLHQLDCHWSSSAQAGRAQEQSITLRCRSGCDTSPRDFVKELNVRLFWSKKKKVHANLLYPTGCGNMLYIMNSLHNEAMMRSRINIRKLWYSRVCPDTWEKGSHVLFIPYLSVLFFFFVVTTPKSLGIWFVDLRNMV